MTIYTHTKDHLLAAMGVLYSETRTTVPSSLLQSVEQQRVEGVLQELMQSDYAMTRLAELMDSATRIECVKTGGDVKCFHGSPSSVFWAHGDVFRAGTVLFVRASYWEHNAPLYIDHRHDYVFHDWKDWIEHDGMTKLRLVVAQPGHWEAGK